MGQVFEFPKSFDKAVWRFRDHFAHKALQREPTLRPNHDGATMYVLKGRYGTIFPYSLDGRLLLVDYIGWPQNPSLSGRRLASLQRAMDPLCISFTPHDGEYSCIFPAENILAVAEIIKVRKRKKPPVRGFVKKQPSEQCENGRGTCSTVEKMGV